MTARLLPLVLLACATPDADSDDGPREVASLDALTTCAIGEACSAVAAVDTVFAGYRKDFFFPYGPGSVKGGIEGAFGTNDAPTYPEANLPDPVHGGRVHVVGRAAVSGSLQPATPYPNEPSDNRGVTAWAVEIDGLDLDAAHDQGRVDWIRIWPSTFEAGDPIWLTLHSEDPLLDSRGTLDVRIPTAEGPAVLEATVSLEVPDVVMTTVAHDADLDHVWVHLRNDSEETRTLDTLAFNGIDVTDVACIADPALAPGAVMALRIPRCETAERGEAWTVAVTWDAGAPSVAGGRVMPPHYPVEAWPKTMDCPLPIIHDANHQALIDAGFDTVFLRGNYYDDACQSYPDLPDLYDALEALGTYALPDEKAPMPEDTTAVAARLLGDEVDNKHPTKLRETRKFRRLAEETAWMNEDTPEVPTYVGGHRNRTIPSNAGVTDIQGMNFNTAGCAPHITEFGARPPLRAPYDYLRSAVINHAPLPTWLYAQALGDWNGIPTAADARISALSGVAAGGRGLMWFQTWMLKAREYPDTWASIRKVNREIRSVREGLRMGGVTGLAHTEDNAIVEVIRVPEGLVVVVIPLEHSQSPDELECGLGTYTPWVIAEGSVRTTVTIPDDLAVVDVFELVDGGAADPEAIVRITEDRRVHLQVPVGPDATGTMIAIASDPEWRETIAP